MRKTGAEERIQLLRTGVSLALLFFLAGCAAVYEPAMNKQGALRPGFAEGTAREPRPETPRPPTPVPSPAPREEGTGAARTERLPLADAVPASPYLARLDPNTDFWIVERGAAEAESVNALAPGAGELSSADSRVRLHPARTEVRATVRGPLALVEVRERFENPLARAAELLYRFPLPTRAVAMDFEMRIGERRIRGVVLPKGEARAVYEEAKRQGYRATLLSQSGSEEFLLRVSRIEPGREIETALSYLQPVSYRQGAMEFVYPLQDGTGSRRRRRDNIDLRVEVEGGFPIADPAATHEILQARKSAEAVRVALAAAMEIPNQPFRLRWRFAEEEKELRLLPLVETGPEGRYLLLALYAPKVREVKGDFLRSIRVTLGGEVLHDAIPSAVPDLPQGEALVLLVRLPEGQGGAEGNAVEIEGMAPDGSAKRYAAPLRLQEPLRSGGAAAPLWARLRIGMLEREIEMEGTRERHSALQREMLRLSTVYGVLSSVSSFVAADASARAGE